jgi:hypothetical protein
MALSVCRLGLDFGLVASAQPPLAPATKPWQLNNGCLANGFLLSTAGITASRAYLSSLRLFSILSCQRITGERTEYIFGRKKVIVEMRTYTVQNGSTEECLRIYETAGLAIQKEVLGNLIAYFYSEIGPLNQIIHLWGFSDLNDRQLRRAKLEKAPGWHEYRMMIHPYIVSQETQIVNCAPFSPIR